MSSGRRSPAPDRGSTRIVIDPAERRQAMLDIISSARTRLVLSIFRCNDDGILDALAAALKRGVSVDAILTKRAKGGKKSLKKLWQALGEIGASVHWYADPVVKYHAKYVVADDQRALIGTLNPTRKCFTRTWDFLFITEDEDIVRSVSTLFVTDAAGERILPRHRISDRLIIGPEGARLRIRELIEGAQRSIRLLDHKLSDPEVVALLRERRDAGVEVLVIGKNFLGSLVPHGKLLIVDESRAVLGSMAMSALSLDFRREVSVVVEEARAVNALNEFFGELIDHASGPLSALPGDAAA